MATVSTTNPDQDQDQDFTWPELDPSQRLAALESLIKQAPPERFVPILAGNQDVGLDEAQLLALIDGLAPAVLQLIALATRSKVIAGHLLSELSTDAVLAELASDAASVQVRKLAAQNIVEVAVQRELLAKLKDKDKTVSKVLTQRLAEQEDITSAEKDSPPPATASKLQAEAIAANDASDQAPAIAVDASSVPDASDAELSQPAAESALPEEAPSPPKTEPLVAEQQQAPLERVPATQEAHYSSTNQEPSASEQEPSASEQEPSASEQEPSASEQEPPASEQEPSASEQEPSASGQETSAPLQQSAIEEEKTADLAQTSADASAENEAPPKPAEMAKTTPAPELDIDGELQALGQSIGKISSKNSARLLDARDRLRRVGKRLEETDTSRREMLTGLEASLEEKLEQNRQHQAALKESTETLLETLNLALEEGRSDDALPAWDKIQGNISNTSGKLRNALQSKANAFKAKITELRDWKVFAATERKKGIIQQMQHLIDSKMHAADRSRHISTMHSEWKALGRSNQNETLWKEFKALSDKAYEPCKAYFKQRKHLMASNLQKRREICAALEAELAQLDQENINIAALNQAIGDAEKAWKQHAPVEQSKIKALQKRFYGTVNQLRQLRKQALKNNGRLKQDLIDQANALTQLDDKRQAMTEAKRLQQEWKKVGPTSFREDKKYWETFRLACDKLFAERNQAAAEQRASQQEAEGKLKSILKSMEALERLGDEELRSARSDYKDLMQSFSASLNPALRRSAKRLVDQFNGIKRKLDTRFKSLPDRKQLALRQAVDEKTSLLEHAEESLFTATGESLEAIKQELLAAGWKELPATGHEACDEALNWRYQELSQLGTVEQFQRLTAAAEEKMRAFCIGLEIRAAIESPSEDQSRRMALQLHQLKQGFGQAKSSKSEDSRVARDAAVHARCFGPLEANVKQSLMQRIDAAIKRLL